MKTDPRVASRAAASYYTWRGGATTREASDPRGDKETEIKLACKINVTGVKGKVELPPSPAGFLSPPVKMDQSNEVVGFRPAYLEVVVPPGEMLLARSLIAACPAVMSVLTVAPSVLHFSISG